MDFPISALFSSLLEFASYCRKPLQQVFRTACCTRLSRFCPAVHISRLIEQAIPRLEDKVLAVWSDIWHTHHSQIILLVFDGNIDTTNNACQVYKFNCVVRYNWYCRKWSITRSKLGQSMNQPIVVWFKAKWCETITVKYRCINFACKRRREIWENRGNQKDYRQMISEYKWDILLHYCMPWLRKQGSTAQNLFFPSCNAKRAYAAVSRHVWPWSHPRYQGSCWYFRNAP